MEQEIIHSKKKKWYKNKWLYIIVIAVLVLGGIVKARSSDKGPQYETVKVERGNLTQTVDATGNVESANELELRFETAGRIGHIYKNTGDEVKAGDLIADLQLNQLNAQVAKASASVAKAQASLDKLLAGSTNAYLASLKAAVAQAQANLDKTTAQYDDSIANAEATVETTKLDLELSTGGEDSQIVQDAYDDLEGLLNAVQNTLSAALTEADNILGIDNTLANDDFEDVLSVLDSSKLNIATSKYQTAKQAKLTADTQINGLGYTNDNSAYDTAANTAQTALFNMKELMFAVNEVLDKTVPIGDLTQSGLETLKANIQTDYTAVNTKYSELFNEVQAVVNAKNSYSTNLIAYNKAVANLENLKKQKTAEVAAYQALLDKAQASYDDAYNPPRSEDIASYQATLAEAQASLASAVATRNQARIVAPGQGVIGKIDGKVGEYVSANDIVVKLVNPHFEIKVDIPETDIIKIALGDEAQVTLDAYSNDNKFAGKVTEIEKGETIIQDVVYYTVTVSLDEQSDKEILNGMTADVMFYTEEKDDVLYIPLRALRTNEKGRSVLVLENGESQKVMVKTGLRGDGGLVEILEGLTAGQAVILSTIE